MKLFLCTITVICLSFSLTEGLAAALTQANSAEPKKAIRVSKDVLLPIIEHFLSMVRKGETDKAYSTYTSDGFKKDTSIEAFKALVTKESVLSHNKLFEHRSFYIEDEIPTFEGDLIDTDGKAVATEIDFIKEKGEWKIIGMQLYQPESITLPE